MTAIAHIGLRTQRPETLRDFYTGGRCGKKQTNPATGFEPYMLSFAGEDCRLERMQWPEVMDAGRAVPQPGLAHMDFACASEEAARTLTARLCAGGCRIVSEPRATGDGYYESVVADPVGNPVEITC